MTARAANESRPDVGDVLVGEAVDDPNELDYYGSRRQEILTIFAEHARGWMPFLAQRFGQLFAEDVTADARRIEDALISEIPYIGGDENPMTRHLIRCTTTLALYKAMKARGKTAEETGEILYRAVAESVKRLPQQPMTDESLAAHMARQRQEAQKSQQRRWPGDWVWEFVEGDGATFDYGYDFTECGAQKFFRAHDAEEVLPLYCYLDFVTYRTPGWGFSRTMTLAEGCPKCDFRFKRGGATGHAWPPPFLRK